VGSSGFVSIMASVMESQPARTSHHRPDRDGPLAGQMLYRWRTGLVGATVLTVGFTFVAILSGPLTEGIFTGFTPPSTT